jgi:hypothetical protein
MKWIEFQRYDAGVADVLEVLGLAVTQGGFYSGCCDFRDFGHKKAKGFIVRFPEAS